jgi:hypothetical protein
MENRHETVARVWRVTIGDLVEHELVRPTEAYLRPKVPPLAFPGGSGV